MKRVRSGFTLISAVISVLIILVGTCLALKLILVNNSQSRDSLLLQACNDANAQVIEDYYATVENGGSLIPGTTSNQKTSSVITGSNNTVTITTMITVSSGNIISGSTAYVVTAKTYVKEFPDISVSNTQLLYRGTHLV